eukprot:gene28336-37397_t
MKPLLLVASNKSASDLMKCGDYRVVGYSNLMANFSGLTLVTQSKLVSRLWDFKNTTFSEKGYRFEGFEEYFIDLFPGKSYQKQSIQGSTQQLAMSMISILQEKIKQPFSYIRRRRENFVVGVTDITLVGWCTLQEYNRARSNNDESTATGDQRRNHIVCSFKIVLTNSTAVSTPSDSVLHRKLKASRHLKRLASRCDCHILRAHRSRMTLSMYSPLAAQPSISLDVNLSIDSDASITTLSPEKEQSLKQMLDIINTEVLRQRVYVLHKPLGVVSSTVDDAEAEGIREGRPTVYDLVSEAGFPSSFAMVGRLDADTSGLVMFTDDSQLARAIRDPDPTDPEDGNLNWKHRYPWAADRKTLKTKEYVLTLLTG